MVDRQKLLFLDLEISPTLGYSYQKYEATIIDVKEESFLLSFAYKWAGEKKITAHSLVDFNNGKSHKDKRLAKELWKVMNEADIIVAHNAVRFDIRKSNTFFIKNGLTPPSPYKVVDTLQVARRYFSFFGNSLDDLARFFKLKGKVEHHRDLWRKCMVGDKKAYKQMVAYNKHDVVLLEQIYKILLPYVSNHPVIKPVEMACPNCGSERLTKGGAIRTIKKLMQRYRCLDCGHWTSVKADKVV